MLKSRSISCLLAGLILGGCGQSGTPGVAGGFNSSPQQVATDPPQFLARITTANSNGSDALTERAFSKRKGLLVFHTDEALDPVHDTNGQTDVYLRNLFGQEVALVSKTPSGFAGNGPSQNASISPDGNSIVFESTASNLVANDTNGKSDIFLSGGQSSDLWLFGNGPITRVSVTASGQQLLKDSVSPVVGGSVIAFTSAGDFTGAGTSGQFTNIYARTFNSSNNTTSMVLVSSGSGAGGNGHSSNAAISASGNLVAFESNASNLAPDGNLVSDVFLRNLTLSTTTRVSVSASGKEPNGASSRPSISDQGNLVAFDSLATNLVSLDTNGKRDVFLRSLLPTPTTTRISLSSSGAQANGESAYPTLARDGSRIAFASLATNLISAPDGNSAIDVFDREVSSSSSLRRVSQTVGGQQPPVGVVGTGHTAGGSLPSYDSTGDDLAFCSSSINLDWANPSLNKSEVYLARRLSNTASLVGRKGLATLENACHGGNVTQANDLSSECALSADGRWVAFTSRASNLVAGDVANTYDIFLRDRANPSAPLLCVSAAPGGPPAGGSLSPSISGDGRYVAFSSEANGLVSGDNNGQTDVFLYDRTTQVVQCISRSSGGSFGSGISSGPRLSADGRFVVFFSLADNLVAGDTNGQYDTFVYDRQLNTMARVSVASNGVQSNGFSGAACLSANGRYVTFFSTATNLTPEGGQGQGQIFVHDRQTATTELVSRNLAGGASNGDVGAPRISADGRFVVFPSSASDLVSGDTNGVDDIFLRDRVLGSTERLSLGSSLNPNLAGGDQANGSCTNADISADGRLVSFVSLASNLVTQDTNSEPDLFVRNRATHTTIRVNVGLSGNQTSGLAYVLGSFPLSADGRYLGFVSAAADLLLPDSNGVSDVFVTSLQFFPRIFNPL